MGSNKEIKEQFAIAPGKDDAGKPIFSVLVKRTYDIKHRQQAVRAEKSMPLNIVDTYYDHGDPQWATVKYESDMVPYKIATDFVVIGKAYSPQGIPTQQMNASVEILNIQKTIRIIGDRKCIFRGEKKPPVFTEPIEFSEMEIRYERAYGGKDEISESNLPLMYPRNYMGKGFAIKNIPEIIDGLQLPNLEDPNDLITPENLVLEDIYHWNRKPLPQGFGWFQKTWYPRSSFAGAVPGFVLPDEVMKEEILGIVPKGQIALARQFKLPSFDVRFNNGASLGLVLPFLSGGESVKLSNMSKDGALEFMLPKDTPKITLDIGFGENELKPYIHTVCVRVDDMQIDIVWRGAQEYPGIDWLPEMTKMETNIAQKSA